VGSKEEVFGSGEVKVRPKDEKLSRGSASQRKLILVKFH